MKLLPIVIFLLSTAVSAQNYKVNDSLLEEICEDLASSHHIPDKARIERITKRYIVPAVYNLKKQKQIEALDFILIRLQRSCKDYRELLNRAYPEKGDWVRIDKKPVPSLDKQACIDFMKNGNYFYFDSSGEKVNLLINDSFWEDRFEDNTFSKLKLSWIGDCEFEIEFIESNNRIRKNYSRPGDKYKYQILEKFEGFYKISVEPVGGNDMYVSKLYY